MRKFLFTITTAIVITLMSFSSCMITYSDDPLYYDHIEVVTTGRAADVYTIVTYGTPHYVDSKLVYYIYNNLYYYPFYYENYWYFRAYNRPFDRPLNLPRFTPRKDDFRFAPGIYKNFGRPNNVIIDLRTNDPRRPFNFEPARHGNHPQIINNNRIQNVRPGQPDIHPNQPGQPNVRPNQPGQPNIRPNQPGQPNINNQNINQNNNRTVITIPQSNSQNNNLNIPRTSVNTNTRSILQQNSINQNTRVTVPRIDTHVNTQQNSGTSINLNSTRRSNSNRR